jgi:hypothetical protein
VLSFVLFYYITSWNVPFIIVTWSAIWKGFWVFQLSSYTDKRGVGGGVLCTANYLLSSLTVITVLRFVLSSILHLRMLYADGRPTVVAAVRCWLTSNRRIFFRSMPSVSGLVCVPFWVFFVAAWTLCDTGAMHNGNLTTWNGVVLFEKLIVEICALLRYYAASNGNPLPTFRDEVSVPKRR